MASAPVFSLFLLFSYINVPNAEMRERPSSESEVVSSAYFSESVRVIEEQDGWAKIETSVDKYQGWIHKGALTQSNEEYTGVARITRLASHVYHVQSTSFGPIITLPFESRVELKDDSDSRWLKIRLPDGRVGYIQRGDVTLKSRLLTRDEVCNLSHQFQGLPYTWGGRSSFGYDCSGFVQMLYRQMGIYLPRDSKDQVKFAGMAPISIEELEPGDLIFWGYSEDKIRHVGFYLGSQQFIHTSVQENLPYLRISNLCDPEWNQSKSALYQYRTARTLKH